MDNLSIKVDQYGIFYFEDLNGNTITLQNSVRLLCEDQHQTIAALESRSGVNHPRLANVRNGHSRAIAPILEVLLAHDYEIIIKQKSA